MKLKRIISTLLAVLMLVSAFTIVSAAEENGTTDGHVAEPAEGWKTSNIKPTIDYFSGEGTKEILNSEGKVTGYEPNGTKVIYTAQDKIDTMDLRFVKDGYELYVDNYSGEVATRCIATGEILFSNPYTIGSDSDSAKDATDSIKTQLMSQLVVKYVDIASGDDNTYYSYEWASQRGQIIVRNIKNGIRVEYTIGREEARMLVPRHIERTSFETKIMNVMEAAVEGDENAKFMFRKLMAYYSLNDPSEQASQTLIDEMHQAFPITKKMAIYVLDNTTSTTEMAKIEQLIKTYCPDYSYEDLDDDHMLTEYESEDKNPPLFKMALEYSLDESGMTVRLPANGIRFNEALYQLYSIEILPYMGAGAKSNETDSFAYDNSGYTFFPDGSGTLFDFEKITDLGASTTVTGKVYGQDYAYHTISGTHQEILRYPVFGVVEKENITLLGKPEAEEGADGEVAVAAEVAEDEVQEYEYKTRGFVAIVEEGDALMELSSYHAVRTSPYNTVRMIVYPRPQDTYNVADAISVGQNDTWTVVSARKYTGNYKIRYIMLTDDAVAEEKGIAKGDYYECSYVGMAKAYREHLEAEEILTRIKAEDVKENLPLYIETFGAIASTKRILSIPVDVTIPLTSFDDIVTMHTQLSDKGIDNINFIMRGYTKGGMEWESVPYNLKWEKAVKGEYDFEELLEYAKQEGFNVLPDFDFVFSENDGLFDGLSLKKHAVKTIDNRYTSKREYSATKQTHVSYYELVLSPAYFSHFYEKFTENYLEYDPMGISVSTLGSYLNSDFDEDEPYNREDSKNFTVQAFQHLAENYNKVATAGGNSYTWKYVDYITDIALDSSRYSQSAASVPFLGMVLHGYVEFAGTPVNMEGNIDYALLKAIENGASLKFILSYQNTDELKEWELLSRYYSIRYDIWFDDVVELYNEINTALKGVQTSVITHHEFVEGERVPDNDELTNDIKNAIEAAIDNEYAIKDAETQAQIDAYREARQEIANVVKELNDSKAVDSKLNVLYVSSYLGNLEAIIGDGEDITALADDIKAQKEKVEALKAAYDAAPTDEQKKTDYEAALVALEQLCMGCDSKFALLYSSADMYLDTVVDLCAKYAKANGEYRELINSDDMLSAAKKAELIALIDAVDKDLICAGNNAQVRVDAIIAQVNAAYDAVKAQAGDALAVEKYEYVITTEADVEEETEKNTDTTVYPSDDNKIVYEVYENGTAFILNFNNYSVMVEVEGVMYTLDAYGYIILTAKN
ncbi:MAG: hypothetical protein J6B72_02400 [Clostridia bacterium]|nr:hypothetical protein [Clostridia bacterium]